MVAISFLSLPPSPQHDCANVLKTMQKNLVHEMEFIHDLTSLMQTESHMKYYFQDPLLIIFGVEIILYLEGQQTVCAIAPTMIFE